MDMHGDANFKGSDSSGLSVYFYSVTVCTMVAKTVSYFSLFICNVINIETYRLSGCPPFWHRRQAVLIRSIMECRYHFSGAEWEDISDSAKDLVSVFFYFLTMQTWKDLVYQFYSMRCMNNLHYY